MKFHLGILNIKIDRMSLTAVLHRFWFGSRRLEYIKQWGRCHNQVNKVSGALYKGVETIDESVQFMLDNTSIQRNNMVVSDSRGRGKQ